MGSHRHWTSDPLDPVIRGDGLYGRGSCDMKGFIAVALGLLPDIQRRALREQLHFAFSFDEELGCLGAPLLLAELAKRGMRPIVAHKGNNAYRCCVNGKSARSLRTPSGVNAIEYAARLICRIRDRGRPTAPRRPVRSRFRRSVFDRADRHDLGRHRTQHDSGTVRILLRMSQSAVGGS
jgi:acetylornithine deacetylase/succinyl-diaminopimelate desuccinylase-like protein